MTERCGSAVNSAERNRYMRARIAIARPRSSVDRAPASEAGCTGSSPVGGAISQISMMKIRPYRPGDLEETVGMWRDSARDAYPYIPTQQG